MTDKNYRIFLKGEDKTFCVKNYMFVGNKCHVTFDDGEQFVYNASNVRIEESALTSPKSRDCFEYLKQVATETGLKAEVEPGKIINILAGSYAKMDFVPSGSMLAAFLNGNLEESRSASMLDLIYPFGFNASQKDAVDKALGNRLSVIEGPPGTGKTQTILNIIANAVMRSESVAVVSSNNPATKNVIDKLEKYGVGFIAAYLGNTENKRAFISKQNSLPNMLDWKLEPQTASKLQKELETQSGSLHEKLLLQNELSALKQELSSVETEQKHFLEYADSVLSSDEAHIIATVNKSQYALEAWLLAESLEGKQQNKGTGSFFKAILERLSPIRRQKRKIKKLLESYSNDVIILSTVDSETTEFTGNANRLNVAVSRAINQLILAVSDGDTQTDANIGDLVRYIEYNNYSIVDSKVYSVFDFLYKSYAERRRTLLAKQKRVSEYDSENLMHMLIKSVLKDERFSRFDVAVHVPLQMIVRDMDNLSATEKQYAGNILTHVDFLIFDRLGKAPRLVVEVDGVSFHAVGSLQAERDNLKNQILMKYSLPIIRFRTDGSSDRSRLIAALETV